MQNFCDYFRGKKITIMGLGLLGRGVGDALFLAQCGADLIVTDLKSMKELAPSLRRLKGYKNISYTLGKHQLEDFRNRDFILKSAGVPLDSPYIAEARKQDIPIEMSASLFTRLSGAAIVGITGTRGKSTTTHLIHHILKTAGKRVHLGGNVKGVSTLVLLKKTKPGDIAVLELDSWQLQGFGDARLSPQIAVFTNFLSDHMNYYKGDEQAYFADKANIFKFQKPDDVLIAPNEIIRYIVRNGMKVQSRIVTPAARLPRGFQLHLPGVHNERNAALAIAVAGILNIPGATIRKAVKSFPGVPGRLEFLRSVRGIKIYNDTTATTPDATIAALRALGKKKNIILIMGGADKSLNMSALLAELPKWCKEVFLLQGTGTTKVLGMIRGVKPAFDTLKKALREAMSLAKRGDIVLFSPAFASFGMFQNEFDRGEQFVKLVKKLK